MKKKTVIGFILLAFCLVCRFVPAVAEFYAAHLYPAISTVLSWLGGIVKFSLEEIVVLGFIVTFVDILVKVIKHKEGFLKWLRKTAVTAMWLYVWFYMGWGNNYYRPGLYQRNGIHRVSFEKEQFTRFLEDYSQNLNSAAVQAQGYIHQAHEYEIRAFYTEQVSAYGYAKLHKWQHVKKPIINPLFSAVVVHGYMGPFFCESQVNRALLDYEYPYVAAHEMGHLAGVTSEAEASYWGFECCRRSENASVRYSGYLSILPYVLSNARNLLSEDEFQAFVNGIAPKAKADYNQSRKYWSDKKVQWIENVQRCFFNLFLKSNGVSRGVKDYSGVVGMIMTMDAIANSQVETEEYLLL